MPAPRVYTWNSRFEHNKVGAEYIIMEKVQGIPLRLVWDKLDTRQKLPILLQAVGWYKAWLSIRFLQSGCIYFADDLDGVEPQEFLYSRRDGQRMRSERFQMGPSVGREWCDDGRASLTCNRGPCMYCLYIRLIAPIYNLNHRVKCK